MYLSLKITKYSEYTVSYSRRKGKLWKFEVFWYEGFSWRRYRRSGWTRPDHISTS